MMISNWKNLLVSIVYTKNYNIQRFKGEKQGVKNVPNFAKHPGVGPIIYKRKLRPSLFRWVDHLFYGYNDFWLLNIGFQWAIISIKKIKVRAYSLLSSLQTYHPTLHLPRPSPPPPTWSLDLFIRVPPQLHGAYSPAAIVALIAISVLSGTHFHLSRVKHLRVECLAQGHNIETMSQDREGENVIFLWKSCTKQGSKPHDSQRHRQS